MKPGDGVRLIAAITEGPKFVLAGTLGVVEYQDRDVVRVHFQRVGRVCNVPAKMLEKEHLTTRKQAEPEIMREFRAKQRAEQKRARAAR